MFGNPNSAVEACQLSRDYVSTKRSRFFGKKKTTIIRALDRIDFEIQEGELRARAFALSVYVDVVYRVEIPKSRFGELTCFLCILGCLNMKLVA